MSESLLDSLSKRERQIMDIIFRHGKANVQVIMDEIQEDLSNSTIRTILRILVNKNILNYEKDGTKFVYSPILKKEKVKKSLLNNIVTTFFENSPYLAVTTMINENSETMSEKELDELEKMIQKLKKENK